MDNGYWLSRKEDAQGKVKMAKPGSVGDVPMPEA